MNMLAILLTAVAATSPPNCAAGAEATRLLAATKEVPTPLGLIVGTGSDWGAKFLVVKTTHRPGVPLITGREGTEKVTYYAVGRDQTCSKEIDLAACPRLDLAIRAYRGRSYSVMFNHSQLRLNAAFHPPFALLHTQDGDGNVTRIASVQSEHPLMHDAAQTFASIESCTNDADSMVGGL